MINSSLQGLDNDKLALIPGRFEDLKKLWKTLKSALVEDLTTFSYFGKSVVKGSRNLHFSFNHADPSFICKLTLSLLTRQAQISQLLNKSIDGALRNLTKDIELYEEKLEQARTQAFDMINDSIKQLVLAKTNYAKERANYEKICKETETTVNEKKKPASEPITYYNLTHQRKAKEKIAEALRNLKIAEQQAQDALEIFNVRQQSLGIALSESMRILKENLRVLFENMIENVKKHNAILNDSLKKEVEEFEASGSLSSIDDFTLSSAQDEQQYIENRKQPQAELLQSADQSAKGDVNLSSKDSKGRFVELQTRLIESPDELSDFEMSEYFDIVQKHYEIALIVFEERHRVIKGLRSYMQDLSNLCVTVERIFQKLSKSSISQACTSALSKKIGSTTDPLFESFGTFSAVFQQLSAFINMKAPLLDSILNGQKEQLKTFQSEYTKIFKDTNVIRTSLVSAGLQHERIRRKISEINEKDADDDRIPILKAELENTKKQREGLLQGFRKQTVEEAKGLNKIFEDYRTQEQVKFSDFSHVIKGFLAQEFLFFKGLMEGFTKSESSLQLDKAIDQEIASAIEQDEALSGLFQHIEKNINPNKSVNEGEVLKGQPAVFKRLYVPPENVEDDDETKSVDGDEDDDQDKGEDVENDKKLAKRFGLKNNDKFVDSFACGVEQKILRQGRMYMYNTAICFSTSKILGDIALMIPLSDIIKIEKKTMSLVFDTALTITTKNGEIKFLSFFYRDKAYNLIANLKKEANVIKEANTTKDASFASSIENTTFTSPSRKGSKAETASKLESQTAEQSKKERTNDVILERMNGTLEEGEGSQDKGEMRRKSLILTEEESLGFDKKKDKESESEKSRRNSQERTKEDGKNTPSDKSVNVSLRLDTLSMSDDKDDREDHIPHIDGKKSKFSTAHYLTTKMTSPLALSYALKPKGFSNSVAEHEGEPLSGFEAGSSNAVSQISSKEASATENKDSDTLIILNQSEKANTIAPKDEEVAEDIKKDVNNTVNQVNEQKAIIGTDKEEDFSKNKFENGLEKSNEKKNEANIEIKQTKFEEKVVNRKDSEEVLREQQEQQEREEAKQKKSLKAIIEQRKLKVRKMLLGDETFQTVVVQEVLACSALDMYAAAFCDKKITHKGKHYDCFWTLVKTEAGDTNIKYAKWTPHTPFENLYNDKESLECLKKFAEGVQKSLRDFSYTHPVKGGGPFVPKECHIEEKQSGYWIGPDEFEMQIQVFSSKVPLSDTFVVHNSFRAKDLPNGKCEFVWKLGVEFVKSTFFKGKITSTSKEENSEYANKVFMPLMREHVAIYLKEKAHELKKHEAKKDSEKEAVRQARAQKKAEALQKSKAEAEAKAQEEEKSTKEIKQEEMSPIKEEEEVSPIKVEETTVEKEALIKAIEEKKASENQNRELNELKSTEEEKSVVESSPEIESVKRENEENLLNPRVTVTESFEEEFAKFVKASAKDRAEMKQEISGLKNLIIILLAMNCFLILLLFFKG